MGPLMPFFKPPKNTLDPYQLELCANVFRQTWLEIVPRGCRLPTREETRLQNEVSDKLCAFAAKGVTDPSMLQAPTVATVEILSAHQTHAQGEARLSRVEWRPGFSWAATAPSFRPRPNRAWGG